MKTLKVIKDEVANTQGHRNWDTFMEYKTYSIKDKFLNKVARRYAEEAIKEAAERAKVKITGNDTFLASISEGDNSVKPEDLSNCTLSVSKESILSLINELK